ncbi:transketolase [Elusimicrobiota bacterium]
MEKKEFDIKVFEERSLDMRREILRMLNEAGSGHSGGSLSSIDLLNVLYFYKMNHRSYDPSWKERDRFIMSKGHASPAVYVTLANCGYFPKEELSGFRKLGRILQGHVHFKVPGVEFSTGSLGQGLAVAYGLALGKRLNNGSGDIYCMLGDGEMQEGSVWETAMAAGNAGLGNLCAILDYNKIQETAHVDSVNSLEPLADKMKAFKWHVIDIDGHDPGQIRDAFDEYSSINDKPVFIIANTVKGKGVSFMEGQNKWHGKAPDDKQLQEALTELGGDDE